MYYSLLIQKRTELSGRPNTCYTSNQYLDITHSLRATRKPKLLSKHMFGA
ncbi:hypothetical protein WH47_05263 [Habropoda laboriosa]|uniref:Uncharacterized protein n=1 Tax=Habropoda laboriosa TaxID=597456 RepID=A0A0L7QVQ7_9HYME|nr:hypothetical protein WH47_05263 [Habropoda laboriosa]